MANNSEKGSDFYGNERAYRQDEPPGGGDNALRAIGNSFASQFGAGKKSRAALALAVSLWIANGGVASAELEPVNSDTTISEDKSDTRYGFSQSSGGIHFTVANGGKVKDINNTLPTNTSGNTVTVEAGGTVVGAYGEAIIGGVSNNEVSIAGTVTGTVYGGYNNQSGGVSTNNHVTVTGTVSGAVHGGYGATATGNKVEILGGTVGDIFGGHGDTTTTNNTVVLKNATVDGVVYGGFDELNVTGNTLIVSGENTAGGDVGRFKTIKLASDLAWDDENAVLTAQKYYKGSLESSIALDVSEATALTNRTESGTMTLIKATGNALPTFTLSGNTITTDGVKVKEGAAQTSTSNGVGITYKNTHTVALADSNKSITYNVANMVNKITLGEMTWGTPRDAATGYNYANITNADIDLSNFTFTNPQNISSGATTLLKANNTLAAIAETTKNLSYTYTPVSGVRLDGIINGSYATTDAHALQYTATENKATKLTFGNVAWDENNPLIDHSTTLTNVSFDGAAVDTTNINFTNIQSLEANKQMTLVSSFGDTVGTITGTKYKVGSTLQGQGKASLTDGGDLIFTAETTAVAPPPAPTPSPTPSSDDSSSNNSSNNSNSGNSNNNYYYNTNTTNTNNTNNSTNNNSNSSGGELVLEVQEQTHNTVMGAMAGMAALSAGNDFIGAATDGLALASNIGADGISSYANMGGGNMRQETGSHVDTHTWNAIIALGHKNEKERGSFEYGAFFEYGTGNYTTFNGDERGDGSSHYTGGGVLAKWTANHGLYVEGSLRAGRVHDDARNVLRDASGMPYSYTTNANYFGFHVGVGKEIAFDDIHTLDVYGKFFYNRRNGVSFDAGGHYDLDAVTSKIVRVGARYTIKSEKWDIYAGAAYEHELDGKAAGKADGLSIRGADTSGGSFRGELGATVTPDKNVPVKLDLNLTGFAGKKRGFSGGVSVALMF